jgi:uncharacterized protein (DUF433 family)
MRLEDYFEFVEPDYIPIKGHRVGIESILRKYLAGEAAEEIAQHYDTLHPIDIYATITYYLENKAVVDTYLARTDALLADDMARSDAVPSPVVLRLRKVRDEGQTGQTGPRAHA